jgi:hypothetical protein
MIRKLNKTSFFEQEPEQKTTNKYSSSLIEEILDALDILQIMEEEYDLVFEEPTPKGWWHTNCPLPGHRDSTPSFGVNPELKVFKCFGCQEKGNLLHFVRKVDGIPFNDAVAKLAVLSGVDATNNSLSAYRTLRDIEATVKAFLNGQNESKLPAGLSPIEYMRVLADRLRAYEIKVNFDETELQWIDGIYKDVDAKDAKEDQKGMSDIWSTLTRELKERYARYQQRAENE